MPFSILRRATSIIAATGLALGFAGALRCQQKSAQRPAFAVASVKLDKTCENPANRLPTMDPVTFRLPCVTVRMLIRCAYGGLSRLEFNKPAPQIVGAPAWADSDIYSIDAKPETRSTGAEMMGPMLQSLLEERFRLKVHTEPRDTPVYLLMVAEPSPKLRRLHDGDCVPLDLFQEMARRPMKHDPTPGAQGSAPERCREAHFLGPSPNGTILHMYGWTMAELSGGLFYAYAGRPVIDNTELKGRFDLRLEFDPRLGEEGKVYRLNGQEVTTELDEPTESRGISFSTALRKQLGLKLTPGKAPLNVIVVDHVERPSAN